MPTRHIHQLKGVLWVMAVLCMVAACSPRAPQVVAPMAPPRTAAKPVNAPESAPTAAPGVALPAARSGEAPEVKVGILLPLSGESQALGASMLDAAVMALNDKYDSLSPRERVAKLVLVPKDTNPGAEEAARQAIAEGAQLLIGPLFSAEVNAVSSVARAKNINVIAFSNNRSVARNGVFLYGFMPEQQVQRVAEFAYGRGFKSIVTLAPSNPYGQTVIKQWQAAAAGADTPLTAIEYYRDGETDLSAAVERVAARIKSGAPPEALFIAEGGDRLKQILRELQAARAPLEKVRLLGTGLWDDPGVIALSGMQGGVFASSPPAAYTQFEKRFTRTYNYKPQRLSSLAYDAVALAATLALDPNGPDFSTTALTSPSGFSGPANGIFRFTADGMSERGLAVLEITPRGVRTIDPAPLLFAK